MLSVSGMSKAAKTVRRMSGSSGITSRKMPSIISKIILHIDFTELLRIFISIIYSTYNVFSKNGLDTIIPLSGQPIGQRTGLSEGDIAAVEFMYGPRVPRPDVAPDRTMVGYSQ